MYDEWPDERWTTTRSARDDYALWIASVDAAMDAIREAADAAADPVPDDEAPECPVYDDTIPY